jgi:hypothetical protein
MQVQNAGTILGGTLHVDMHLPSADLMLTIPERVANAGTPCHAYYG